MTKRQILWLLPMLFLTFAALPSPAANLAVTPILFTPEPTATAAVPTPVLTPQAADTPAAKDSNTPVAAKAPVAKKPKPRPVAKAPVAKKATAPVAAEPAVEKEFDSPEEADASPAKAGVPETKLIRGADKPSQVSEEAPAGKSLIRKYEYARYAVETQKKEKEADEKITVVIRPSTTVSVEDGTTSKPAKEESFAIPVKGRFFGINDHWLFVEQGLEGAPKSVVIFDLNTKKQIYKTLFNNPIFLYQGLLMFWRELGPATPETCPEYEIRAKSGGKPALEEMVLLDLKAEKLVRTHITRCAERP
jgi:hypothetical protein